MTALASHYAPDPDALTPRERAIVEAWNAKYPDQPLPLTCAGHGKLMYSATFDDHWRARYLALIETMKLEAKR